LSVQTIEAEALSARLDSDNLLLVQVTTPEVFAAAHLPNAVLVPPQELVCGIPPATGKLPNVEQLTTLFRRIGYRDELDIVTYDDEGGGWAGRFAWTLDCIGHRSWTYLNGGLQAWHAAGLPLESGSGRESEPTAVDVTVDPTPIAEIEDVLQAIEDPDQVIWDVRSPEEYSGHRQAAARAGHIPTAINLDWMRLKNPIDMRLVENVEKALADLGISSRGKIITHCQTHHRSGLSYMVGRLLGLDIRAYHGSWSEWGNREDTPIET
jgi:thiosulfate/3-mercaptopyruvate sulfurtransferase